MATPPRFPLVIADTNVPLDLARGRDVVVDAVAEIRRRLRGAHLLIPPTVVRELTFLARQAEEEEVRENAQKFLQLHRRWGCYLINATPLDERTAEDAADSLRSAGLLPESEVNDSHIVIEAAALRASLLLTSDEHMRAIDFQQLKFALERFGLDAPVIATPTEIVRSFLR